MPKHVGNSLVVGRSDALRPRLDEIVVTDLLHERPSRAADHAAENRALVALARALAESPDTLLQKLVNAALELTGAGSAGISVLEGDGDKAVFRWRATAGAFLPLAYGTLPRDFSPCGVVLDRNAPQLMCEPVRAYPNIANVQPHISEVLLVPFHCGERPIGTVWVVAHTDAKHFDAEDERVITSLSKFAAAALQVVAQVEESEAHARSLEAEVAERTRADEALQASEERYRRLVETAHEGIWTIDAAGRTTYVNRRMAELLRYTPEEMIGRVHTDFMWEQDRPKGDVDMELRRQGTAQVWDQRYRRKDGSELWTVASCNTLYDAEGKFVAALGMFTDITRRKRAEAERQALLERERIARSEAERANEAKDRFIAVLSHELRTPLSPVVMTVAELEQHPDLPDDVRESMSMIRRNIDLETRLIDDLLDLSRVTSGKLRLRMEQTSLHDVLRHAYEVSADDMNAKRLKIKFDFAATNDQVIGDPSRLQQVFWNLMKNAVKFSPEGSDITVRTSDVGPGRIRVDVIDNGIGIEPKDLPRIFDAFEQGDAHTTPQFGGLGLGLAISRAVIDMHGGTITAASGGADRGATFTVELNTTESLSSPAPADKSSQRPSADREPCRVLLVEDHPDTARVMGRLLGHSGYLVTVANSVASALKFAEAGPFDIVISDIGLPDASGHDLMRQLKTLYGMKGIALSGYGMEDDVRRGREAGFDDHVTKPVNLSQLHATIERVLGRNGKRAT